MCNVWNLLIPPLSESHPRKRMKMERYADDGDTRAYKERMGEVDMTQGRVYSKLLLICLYFNIIS